MRSTPEPTTRHRTAVIRSALASRRTLEVLTRGLGLLACLVVALATQTLAEARQQLALVLILAIAASLPQRPPWLRYATILAEAAVIAIIVVTAPMGIRPSIAYLLVPPVIAGISAGTVGVVAAATTSGLVLAVGTVLRDRGALPAPVVEIVVWLSLAIAVGLAAVLARHLRARVAPPSDYDAARRLLTSLREVARALPGGLEETVLARATLDRLADLLPHDRAEVFLRGPRGSLVGVASVPADVPGWIPSEDRGLWGQAFDAGTAVQRLGELGGPELGTSHACAVIPLRLGDRVVGAVAVERRGGLWTTDELAAAQGWTDEAALRLDTARLFDEIRELATVEERRRLSREIHDGIAQEIAGLGFLVDDALRGAEDPGTRSALERIRGELTRIVTELRLSIFDLRSDAGAGIGEALSSYVREVGTDADLTVHLVLDEDPSRLPAGIAPEILRIAQEAVTNARRHAAARTLWVTYRVDEGTAFLRVADDGRGLDPRGGRSDSFGMQIMRERAARIGGLLTIRPRPAGGTVVELTVGPAEVPAQMP